jgi:hypothetical protein
VAEQRLDVHPFGWTTPGPNPTARCPFSLSPHQQQLCLQSSLHPRAMSPNGGAPPQRGASRAAPHGLNRRHRFPGAGAEGRSGSGGAGTRSDGRSASPRGRSAGVDRSVVSPARGGRMKQTGWGFTPACLTPLVACGLTERQPTPSLSGRGSYYSTALAKRATAKSPL